MAVEGRLVKGEVHAEALPRPSFVSHRSSTKTSLSTMSRVRRVQNASNVARHLHHCSLGRGWEGWVGSTYHMRLDAYTAGSAGRPNDLHPTSDICKLISTIVESGKVSVVSFDSFLHLQLRLSPMQRWRRSTLSSAVSGMRSCKTGPGSLQLQTCRVRRF